MEPTRARESFGQEYQRTPKGAAIRHEAQKWGGWGTALKPAWEMVLARKAAFRGFQSGKCSEARNGGHQHRWLPYRRARRKIPEPISFDGLRG